MTTPLSTITTYAPLSTSLTHQGNGSISSNSVLTINTNNTRPSLRVDGDFEVNGRDVLKELDEIRELLTMLTPDNNMEEKYPKLKEIRDAYNTALAKYTTLEIIKKST